MGRTILNTIFWLAVLTVLYFIIWLPYTRQICGYHIGAGIFVNNIHRHLEKGGRAGYNACLTKWRLPLEL